MKTITLVTALLTAVGTSVARAEPTPVNPYNGMQQREEVFRFTKTPTVRKDGNRFIITFASGGRCDATVAIVGPDGRVVRHLASGVLGPNAPHPFRQNALAQRIEWDGGDDRGRPAPAGCKVRVSLGLDARVEKFHKQNLFTPPKALAVDKDGYLYYATFDGILSGSVHVFDRRGRYVRTIFPPPSTVRPARLSLLDWNRTAGGEAVPRRNRWGGGWDFTLDKFRGFFIRMQQHTATVTPDGRLALLCSVRYGMPVTRLLLLDTRDGAAPPGSIVKLGQTSSAGMAVSPDGKWLYFAGMGKHHGGGPLCHAVLRTSLDKPGVPKPFLGQVDRAGSDNAHFDAPEGVACDRQGNLYISDVGNNRTQVFRPDGRFLKTIPNVTGLMIHPKTGATYSLGRSKKWPKPFVLARLGTVEESARGPEIVFAPPKGCAPSGGRAVLDPTSDPPAIWFVGHYRGRGPNPPLVVRIEDRGDRLVRTADALKANGLSAQTGEGDRQLSSHQLYLGADEGAGQCVPGAVVGPDGLRYQRTPGAAGRNWIIRLDPDRDKYVPFAHGEPARQSWDPKQVMTHNDKPVIGIPLTHGAGGPHEFQSPFDVAPNGDVYAPCYTRANHPEMKKAGLAPPVKENVCCDNLWVFGSDGKVKSVSALPGLTMSDGIRVGRNGAVYIVLGLKPLGRKLPDGLAATGAYPDTRWGSLVKFNSAFDRFPIGRIVGYWEGKDADKPTHRVDRRKVGVENAHWVYGGVSPVSTSYNSCTCLKSSFDLDGYERSFVCAAQTFTVNVIDANGNLVARLGGYGNLDSRGQQSPVLDPGTGALRPRRPDDPKGLRSPARPLGFNLPRSVAVTDQNVWVHDVGNRTIVRLKLVYRAEESVPLP